MHCIEVAIIHDQTIGNFDCCTNNIVIVLRLQLSSLEILDKYHHHKLQENLMSV